jgi:hypothetical protein
MASAVVATSEEWGDFREIPGSEIDAAIEKTEKKLLWVSETWARGDAIPAVDHS